MLRSCSIITRRPALAAAKIGVSPPLAEGPVGSDYLLVSTASGDLQVWDLEQSALVSVGAAHSEEITDCQWAPDGKQIISVGKDACICVWNFYGADIGAVE